MATPRVLVGVDIGGTKVMAVAVDAAHPGDVIGSVVEPTPLDAASLVSVIVSAIAAVRDTAPGPALAVGLGVAGYIDHGGIARRAPNLGPAIGVDLAGPVRVATGLAVVVDNDANCAARAALALDAPDASPLVMITLGTGIGGALALDGAVVRGAHGFAGEWGHMIVDPDGPLCVCGQHGCWERFASGSALARLGREAVEAGEGASLLDAAGSAEAVSGPLVAALAAAGDAAAVAVLDTFARWVALGLLNVVNVIDPAVVILGGGLVSEGDRLLGRIRDAYAEHAGRAGAGPLDLRIASVGSGAGAVGAALLAGTVAADR